MERRAKSLFLHSKKKLPSSRAEETAIHSVTEQIFIYYLHYYSFFFGHTVQLAGS